MTASPGQDLLAEQLARIAVHERADALSVREGSFGMTYAQLDRMSAALMS